MIKILLGLILIFQASFSLAEEEVFDEIDEIQEVIEDTKKLEKNSESNDLLKELNKLGHDKLDLNALKDPRINEFIEKQFDESNISLMSLAQKRKLYEKQFKDSILKVYLDKVPKIRDLFIDLVTDKNSIMGFVAIYQHENRLYVLYVALGVFIFNLLLKKMIISPDSNFIFRFFQRLTINLFCSCLMFGIIFYLFKKELTPVVRLIASHF